MLTFQPLTLQGTIFEMYDLARAYAANVAYLNLRSLPDIYRFVVSVPYIRDVDAPECAGAVECVKSPPLTLQYGGDCDDKAILAGALVSLLGVPWRIVTVNYDGSGEMIHTYIEVFVSGRWLPLDATTGEVPLYHEKPFSEKLIW